MSQDTVSFNAAETIVSLAKALDVEIPENEAGKDEYTTAFGQQLMTQLAAKLDEHRANVPMPVFPQEAVEAQARESLIQELTTKLGLEAAEAPQIVAALCDNLDEAVAEFDERVAGQGGANPESLSLEISSGTNNTVEYTTEIQIQRNPDRELTQATLNDNKYVQATMAAAIGRVNQMRDMPVVGDLLNLDRPLTNFSKRDGYWDEGSLTAVNSVLDLLKERNGLSDQFPESGYTPELGRALQAKINELKEAPIYDLEARAQLSAMNEILDEGSRNRLFQSLDRLHAANELRPVTVVETEVEVRVPVQTAGNETDVDTDNTVDATTLDPNNESHAPLIEARDSISGFAKVVGVSVPAQYSAEFGQNVIAGLDRELSSFMDARGGDMDAAAKDAWITHLTEKLGLEVNDANKAKVEENYDSARDEVLALDSAMRGGLVVALDAWTAPGTNPTGNTTTVNNDLATQMSITAVEGVLFQLGSQLDNLPGMGGMGGMISQFGLTDTLVTPLTEADLNDGVFGANSQDLAHKLIMGLKMMNGDENPDGSYNQAVGENLRLAILTKPEFSFVRDQIKSEDGTPLRFFGAGGGALTGATAEQQQQLARQLLTFDSTEPEAPPANADQATKDAYEAQMQARAQFAQTHEKDLQAVRQLNAFFQGLDHLEREGMYDNEKARQTNKQNLMLDAASGLLDQWAPGIKSWLQDFFTNSQFGQMISGILSQFFGINVGRLWGDRDDEAALDRSQPLIEENFSSFYNSARQELGGTSATHDQVMEQVRSDIMEKMNHGAFKLGMDLLFKDQDEDVVRQAVEKALDAAAENSNDRASAQAAFSASLMASGREFRQGQELSAEETQQFNDYLREASYEIRQAGRSNVTGNDLNIEREGLDDDGSTIGTSEVIAAAVGDGRERDLNQPAVDAEVIEAGEKNVELIYTPNNDSQIQGPTRYAHGRVDDIQAVLGDNAEALGLSLNAEGMKNTEGNYSDMMTPYTNAVIEETLIRAQIHKLQSESVVITQEHLDGFDRTLNLDNLDVVTSYLEDKGVSAAEIASFTQAVIGPDGAGIGTDYFSTDARDRTAGDRQEHTVLEQSHFGNQFDLKLAQWVPEADLEEGLDLTEEDPLRDRYLEYNKDRPCEIPLFFTKDGDTSVFAIIRDKQGNDDPSDDVFRELDMDLYLSTRVIQDGDADDLKALLDNYNWENPTQQGVQDVINKVLGLDPLERTATLSTDRTVERTTTVERDQSEVVVPRRTVQEDHDRPEAFRDLRNVTSEQAQFLTQALGLNARDDVMRLSERDIIDPLEVYFDQQMRSSGGRSGMIMLELEAHGIEHPDMDVVLAYRNERGNLEFRYVDYETDAITPIPQQRAGNTDITDGFDRQAHVSGNRRLDDFIDEISHNNGAYVKQGITDGYLGLRAIVPDGNGHERTLSAFEAIYGTSMMRSHVTEYVGATSARYADRTAFEQQQRRQEFYGNRETHRNGLSEDERRRLDEVARTRSGGFNNASGAQHRNGHDHEYGGLAGEAWEHTPKIIKGPTTALALQVDAFRRILAKGPFHGPNWTPEEHEEVFRQNSDDMDLNESQLYQNGGVTYDPAFQR